MDVDWSVELGAEDPVLEFPWSSPDGKQRYVNLSQHPDAIAEVSEAVHYPELGEFLRKVNTESSPWVTAKCDVWLNDEIAEAEPIYDANVKFCSYVDLVARDSPVRSAFERHESWVKATAGQLDSATEEPIACEFIVRRCWTHSESADQQLAFARAADQAEPRHGFYVTFYLFGYGAHAAEARTNWAEGLRRVTGIIAASAA
jgi:hypothetical protein